MKRILAITALLLLVAASVRADVKLPAILASNMVLQRNQPLPIWGWADPGEEVTVALGDNTATAKADDMGRWMVRLKAMPADGKTHAMTVKGKNTITLSNLLIGEVWLCSGQSNMEWTVAQCANPVEETKNANYPNIRLFQVLKIPAGEPVTDINATWSVCSPASIASASAEKRGFSATAYYFGRELHKQLNVPVGLVHSSWGGTRIEPWTPPVGFQSLPSLKYLHDIVIKANAGYRTHVEANVHKYEAWVAAAKKALAEDKPVPPLPGGMPKHPLESNNSPTGLYNGMIAPLVPFAIRGAIWYQGESNRGQAMHYRDLMEGLITGWRKTWNQETNRDFPFYFVQLAPFDYKNAPTALPEIWEAQVAAWKTIPNTGMCVTTDLVDNINDIHPKNKQDVGKRLALIALANTYGKSDIVYSGPIFKDAKFDGGKAVITFDHLGGGLAALDGKPLTHFQLAGEDRKFVEAQAVIDGDTVVVTAPGVDKPVAVRFGWDHKAMPNFGNKAGLPASPFRTDKWEEPKAK